MGERGTVGRGVEVYRVQQVAPEQVARLVLHGQQAQWAEEHRVLVDSEVLAAQAIAMTKVVLQSRSFVARSHRHDRMVSVVIASDHVGFLDGTCEGLAHTVIAERPCDLVATLSPLMTAVPEWTVLRLRTAWPGRAECLELGELGLQLSAVFVRKDLAPFAAQRDPAAATVRRAEEADGAFIRRLLLRALQHGLEPWERATASPVTLCAKVERMLDGESLPGGKPTVWIAERATERLGMALASFTTESPLVQGHIGHLHDVFVDVPHRGRGVSTALTMHVEHAARAAQQRLLTGSVRGEHPAHTLDLLDHIAPFGWLPGYAIWTWCRSPTGVTG